jgi:hypothetical protein
VNPPQSVKESLFTAPPTGGTRGCASDPQRNGVLDKRIEERPRAPPPRTRPYSAAIRHWNDHDTRDQHGEGTSRTVAVAGGAIGMRPSAAPRRQECAAPCLYPIRFFASSEPLHCRLGRQRTGVEAVEEPAIGVEPYAYGVMVCMKRRFTSTRVCCVMPNLRPALGPTPIPFVWVWRRWSAAERTSVSGRCAA